MEKSRIQPLHHGIIRPFLGTENDRGAGGAAQGIINIAHGHHPDAAQGGVQSVSTNTGNIMQRAAHRNKGFARPIIKRNAQRRSGTAAAVIGGAAA